ncbi:MAG: GTP-binding protein [Planctomyces sp.]|nr:GTP-binding protein [Planctomyces sp.]
MNKIPINLITGFLGAGKTSAIQSLLAQRPAHERWAVLINEYGMVSLDHILVNDIANDAGNTEDSTKDNSGVDVDEMAGGCFCCSLAMELPLMLARMIRRTQPHRIILEPTGSGHPASVIDLLRSGRLGERLELRATIALVDPRDCENPRITNADVFHDQLQMADVVAINFGDKCSSDQIQRCRNLVVSLDPPKLLIAETTQGKLSLAWLDLSGHMIRQPLFADAHTVQHNSIASENPELINPFSPPTDSIIADRPFHGKPVRFENQGLGKFACGWVFHEADVFDRDEIIDLLAGLHPILRLKGVFHCSDDWWSIQRRGSDTTFQRTAWRRDSRVEIITEFQSDGWDVLQEKMLNCRISSQ